MQYVILQFLVVRRSCEIFQIGISIHRQTDRQTGKLHLQVVTHMNLDKVSRQNLASATPTNVQVIEDCLIFSIIDEYISDNLFSLPLAYPHDPTLASSSNRVTTMTFS